MSDKKDKAAKVKELALAGKFQEIKASYGQSSVIKAKEYVTPIFFEDSTIVLAKYYFYRLCLRLQS